MQLDVRELTADLWPALEDLFDDKGPVSRCWCMYWRIGSSYRNQPREANKALFQAIVKNGPPPGLLAFDGDIAVGWCQLTPRDDLPWLDRTWRLKRVDDALVWSLSCFFIRKRYRRKGVTAALINAAIYAAKQAGIPALEAYPLDGDISPSSTSNGYMSTFLRAGFTVVAQHAQERPIMRYVFDLPSLQSQQLQESTKALDEIYAEVASTLDPGFGAAQSQALPKEEW